jgi:trk system potassium uptake protein TrkA
MRIVIVGAGGIGTELLNNLRKQQGNEIVIIDSDEKNCETLASQTDALVVNGDGTDPRILQKAQVEDADVLVATTGSDALNTVIAMLGKSFEVERIIVKLDKTGLRSANQAIGVQKIVAPKVSTVAEILSAVHGFDRVDFSLAGRGGLHLVELAAGPGAGQRISDLELPDGAHYVAAIREDEVVLPRAGMKLSKDDKLLVLVEDENARRKVQEMFARQED